MAAAPHSRASHVDRQGTSDKPPPTGSILHKKVEGSLDRCFKRRTKLVPAPPTASRATTPTAPLAPPDDLAVLGAPNDLVAPPGAPAPGALGAPRALGAPGDLVAHGASGALGAPGVLVAPVALGAPQPPVL